MLCVCFFSSRGGEQGPKCSGFRWDLRCEWAQQSDSARVTTDSAFLGSLSFFVAFPLFRLNLHFNPLRVQCADPSRRNRTHLHIFL